ncbi:MAG: efflux RND transporter periplasmic adaptor subunit, partial [Lentisphaeria bacterium]|nr:efflux RND transporter periplasmic adaptor subunit [Lentisphaeria bacterium]
MNLRKIFIFQLSLFGVFAGFLLIGSIGKPASDEHSCESHPKQPPSPTDASRLHDHDSEDEHEEDDEHNHAAEADYPEGTLFLSTVQQQEGGLKIAAVENGVLAETLELLGEIRLHPSSIAHVVPPIPGFIRTMSVKAGDIVHPGKELLTLFSPELAELKCDYLEKKRSSELTRLTFDRKEFLRKEKIGMEADWQEAKFNLESALSAQQLASQRLLSLGLPQGELNELERQDPASYGVFPVIAPQHGVILEQIASQGSRVEHDTVLVIADLREMQADFQVPLRQLEHLQIGQNISVSTLDGNAVDGKISLITPAVNSANQTVTVCVMIPNPDGRWRQGLFVRGERSEEH